MRLKKIPKAKLEFYLRSSEFAELMNEEKIVEMNKLDLSGMDLRNLNFKNGIFIRTNFSNAQLDGCNFEDANFEGANFSNASLVGANLKFADFSKANLSYANLQSTKLTQTSFVKTNLQGANLIDSDFHRAYMGFQNRLFPNITGAILEKDLTFEQYLVNLPKFLTVTGKKLDEVCAVWNCHEWKNCPMAIAFNVKKINNIPKKYQREAERFVMFFDAGLIPNPLASAA